MPPINRSSRRHYAKVLGVLQSIRKRKEWRNYVTKGAGTFTLVQLMQLFKASTLDKDGVMDLRALRNKTLAVIMLLFGYHPIDAQRLWDSEVRDRPDHHDREGFHRPKMIFGGSTCFFTGLD